MKSNKQCISQKETGNLLRNSFIKMSTTYTYVLFEQSFNTNTYLRSSSNVCSASNVNIFLLIPNHYEKILKEVKKDHCVQNDFSSLGTHKAFLTGNPYAKMNETLYFSKRLEILSHLLVILSNFLNYQVIR